MYLGDRTDINDYMQREKNSTYFKMQIMSTSQVVSRGYG